MTVISAASKNPEATFLFMQWLADKKQQESLSTPAKAAFQYAPAPGACRRYQGSPQRLVPSHEELAGGISRQAQDAEIL